MLGGDPPTDQVLRVRTTSWCRTGICHADRYKEAMPGPPLPSVRGASISSATGDAGVPDRGLSRYSVRQVVVGNWRTAANLDWFGGIGVVRCLIRDPVTSTPPAARSSFYPSTRACSAGILDQVELCRPGWKRR